MAQDSPFKLQKVADFGTSEPWLARIELGIPEVAKFTISDRAAREAFPEIWHHVGTKLAEAFATLVTIRKLSSDPETPLIQLSKEYNSLYSLLWAAYKDRWQTAMKTIGFDFGFLFVADKNFENSFALFGKEHPTLDLAGLKQLAISERTGWQNQLANHRNDDIEHRKDGSDLEFFQNPRSAEAVFYNVWRTIEDWTIVSLNSFVSKPMVIIQIPKAERDPAAPKKYAVGMDQSLPIASSQYLRGD